MRITHLFLLMLGGALAGADDPLQEGIDAYHESDFAAAASAFEAAIAQNETAAAHHNRALALYRQGKPGESAWHLERALLLAPGNEQYHFKLGALRQQLGLHASNPKWYDLASQALSQPGWVLLLCFAFWFTLAALWLPRAGGFRVSLQIKAARAIGLIGLILAGAALYQNRHLDTRGIVLSDSQVTLHAAPASAAPQVGLARPGERGQKVDQHGDYVEIVTEGGARGWIEAAQYRLIEAKA